MKQCTTTTIRKCLETAETRIAKTTYHKMTCNQAWCTYVIAKATHALYVRNWTSLQFVRYADPSFSRPMGKSRLPIGRRIWNVLCGTDGRDMVGERGHRWKIRKRRNRRRNRVIVTVDQNDFVVSVQHEQTESAIREIHRSEAMPEATRICKGPWHYKGGKGTPMPVSAFRMSMRNPGSLNSTCNECLDKNAHTNVASAPVRYTGNPVLPTPVLENGGEQHKWEVTYTTTTTTTVYAKTWTEAGTSVGDVEVTNVHRVD